LLVYDLGGGTFDASLVELAEKTHNVAGTEGIGTLGGDDFDDVLAELALDAAGIAEERRDSITPLQWTGLREICRERKEALHPNTRKVAVDLESAGLSEGEVSVAASDFYERCQRLVDETLRAVNDLLARHGLESSDEAGGRFLEAVYVCGGGSELPLVPRDLRERFGRRVKRSAHGHTATAIGLAIRADQNAGYEVHERFTRHFGVWREAQAGALIAFDPLFLKGAPLPPAGEPPLSVGRRYRPAHNVGHFRYLECSA
jgi:molecular chaperone DnaK (HSP70)